jgi:UDPglucose 6-dehydrogenase
MQEKVDKINKRISPVQDDYLEKYMAEKDLHLSATMDAEKAYKDADIVIISAPTNYDPKKDFFDCTHVEEVLKLVLETNDHCTIVIKSTIPVGYTVSARERFNSDRIIFSPEFLRESKALYDNLYPSRIIVGYDKETDDAMVRDSIGEASKRLSRDRAEEFASLLKEASLREDVPVLIMGLTEAEAVKLFANTYLALRVSYFNELDTYAETKNLSTGDIIKASALTRA